MLQRLSDMLKRRDEGFTLIELMVVVLIIGILIAIAIPTFLGARQRAQDRAAQSSLRNALTNAKAIYTDHEDYANANAAALASAEPSLTFKDGGNSTGPTNISDAPGTSPSTAWLGAALSKSGKCFYIKDQTNGPGTTFASVAAPSPAGTCDASSPPAAGSFTNAGW